MSVIGRLRDRVSLETANAQLQTVSQRLQLAHPRTNARVTARATPLDDFVVGDTRLPLLTVLASVVIMLLIACTATCSWSARLAASVKSRCVLHWAPVACG
jgi:hypothetical protein